MAAFVLWICLLTFLPHAISTTDHCKLCKDHTTCQFKGSSPTCGENSESGVISPSEAQKIVNVHNFFRAKIAKGLEARGAPGPQPPAADMNALVWDNELAKVAQQWADQCTLDYDKCRSDPRFPVGQNIFITTVSSKTDWRRAITAWYKEVARFDRHSVAKLKSNETAGNYTQIVWAKTRHIGCGRTTYGAPYNLPESHPAAQSPFIDEDKADDTRGKRQDSLGFFGGAFFDPAGAKGALGKYLISMGSQMMIHMTPSPTERPSGIYINIGGKLDENGVLDIFVEPNSDASMTTTTSRPPLILTQPDNSYDDVFDLDILKYKPLKPITTIIPHPPEQSTDFDDGMGSNRLDKSPNKSPTSTATTSSPLQKPAFSDVNDQTFINNAINAIFGINRKPKITTTTSPPLLQPQNIFDGIYPNNVFYPNDRYYPNGAFYPDNSFYPDGGFYPNDQLYYPNNPVNPNGGFYPSRGWYPNNEAFYPNGQYHPNTGFHPDNTLYPSSNGFYYQQYYYPSEQLPSRGESSYANGGSNEGGNMDLRSEFYAKLNMIRNQVFSRHGRVIRSVSDKKDNVPNEGKSSLMGRDQILVCNYGPVENFVDQPVYTKGKACSKCPPNTTCKKNYGLCFEKNIQL